MNFPPYPTRSGFVLLSAALLFIAVAAFLTYLLLQQNDPPRIFNLLVSLLGVLAIIGIILHWTLVAFKLGYHINRNGLAIQWGLGQQLVPFSLIQTIIPGKDINTTPAKIKGANIAGLRFGRGELPGYGLLRFRATAPLTDSLLVITPRQTYVISPNQPQAFLKAWQMRQPLGATQQWSEGTRRRWPFNLTLLTDTLTWWLLGVAAFFCFALLGYLSLNYPDLPASLPIHYNSLGQADRIADKTTLFTLPAAGGIVWVGNLILGSFFYHQEKIAAYLLWSSTIVVQLCLWVAMVTITG